MRKEILLYKRLGHDFQAVYIGGGTPTILMDELTKTVHLLRSTYGIKELSIETNPNHLTKDRIEALIEMGTDRLSVGVQSFDELTLKRVGRYHKYGSGAEIAERLCAAMGKFKTLNVDMIFNFPFQTHSMLERDLETLVSLDVDQITYYPLMVSSLTIGEMEKKMGRMCYAREKMFYKKILQALLPRYQQRTVWCYSKREGLIDEYVVKFPEYVGMGSGSIGYVDGTAFANTFNVKRYVESLQEGVLPIVAKKCFSARERVLYDLFMSLFGLRTDLQELRKRHRHVISLILPEILFLSLSGAIKRNGGEIVLTQRGKYLLLVFMREFFTAVNNFREFLRATQ
ncbi:MAG: coproporphyrinogen III oxidase family protein [Candidatus Bathyarchaeia archaeon]